MALPEKPLNDYTTADIEGLSDVELYVLCLHLPLTEGEWADFVSRGGDPDVVQALFQERVDRSNKVSEPH